MAFIAENVNYLPDDDVLSSSIYAINAEVPVQIRCVVRTAEGGNLVRHLVLYQFPDLGIPDYPVLSLIVPACNFHCIRSSLLGGFEAALQALAVKCCYLVANDTFTIGLSARDGFAT